MISIKGSFDEARFEAELAPQRSLGQAGSWIACGLSALLLGGVSGFALIMSQGRAWPVAVFAFLAQGGLQYAFSRNARAAGERQLLTMDEDGLQITHTRPDWDKPLIHKIEYPTMARVVQDSTCGIPKIFIRHHARQIRVGDFLPPVETEQLGKGLKTALRAWRPAPTTA
ncbi:MAG: DUF2244 domain-containing protein [Micavibrio aeruginosavorus]|uniref:DUF2244 domain-containing protein n=1 Tax=Micavibrio aeruginosavorus TaxID=349221 RepID=A0A7T5R3T4_9BACT|nr:MAG: DUF2244 domain-containing protein [Micavibrio aeruginosavorus]